MNTSKWNSGKRLKQQEWGAVNCPLFLRMGVVGPRGAEMGPRFRHGSQLCDACFLAALKLRPVGGAEQPGFILPLFSLLTPPASQHVFSPLFYYFFWREREGGTEKGTETPVWLPIIQTLTRD